LKTVWSCDEGIIELFGDGKVSQSQELNVFVISFIALSILISLSPSAGDSNRQYPWFGLQGILGVDFQKVAESCLLILGALQKVSTKFIAHQCTFQTLGILVNVASQEIQ
jgi:hypothetical protein